MLSPIDTIKIFENHPDRVLKAGEVLFEDGTVGDVMYGVLEGEIQEEN